MRWRMLVGALLMGSPILTTGCQQEKSLLARQLTIEDMNVATLDAPSPTIVARSQKGEEASEVVRPVNRITETSPGVAGDVVGSAVLARVRATVNGVAILDEEIESVAYQQLVGARRLPEPQRTLEIRDVKKKALDQLIERELLISDARARLGPTADKMLGKLEDAARKEFDRQWVRTMIQSNGVKDEQALRDLLREQGLPLETIRRQWIRNFISTEYLKQIIMPALEKIGHEQLAEYYRVHPEDFEVKDSVQWHDIFVSVPKHGSKEAARKVAEQVLQRVRGGEEMTALCRQYDDGDSVLREGQGSGRTRGEIKPVEAEEIIFQMKEGDPAAMFELPHGFHVVRVIKREYAGKKPFDDDAQKEIRNKLRNEAAEQERKRVIARLKRKAVIEYAKSSP